MLHFHSRHIISSRRDCLTMRSWKLWFYQSMKNKSISFLFHLQWFLFFFSRDKIWQSENVTSWPCGTWPQLAFPCVSSVFQFLLLIVRNCLLWHILTRIKFGKEDSLFNFGKGNSCIASFPSCHQHLQSITGHYWVCDQQMGWPWLLLSWSCRPGREQEAGRITS